MLIFGCRTQKTVRIKFGIKKMDFSQCWLNKGKIWVATCWPPVSGIRAVWRLISFYHEGLSLVQRGSPDVFPILRPWGGATPPLLSLPLMAQRWPCKGLSRSELDFGPFLTKNQWLYILGHLQEMKTLLCSDRIEVRFWAIFKLKNIPPYYQWLYLLWSLEDIWAKSG